MSPAPGGTPEQDHTVEPPALSPPPPPAPFPALAFPAAALGLLVLVQIGGLEEPLFYFFNHLSRWTGQAIWAHVTILGDGLVTAVLFLPWVRRQPERVVAGLFGALVMFVVLRLFKDFVSLPRPLAVLPEGTVEVIGPGHRRSAFPSGHTATFFLFAGVWALSARRRSVSWLLGTGAALVGVSRMAVGVHWPSDVLAGAALGWASAWLGLRWALRGSWPQRRVARGVLGGLLLVCAAVLFLAYDTGYPGVEWWQRSLAACSVLLLLAPRGAGAGAAQAAGAPSAR